MSSQTPCVSEIAVDTSHPEIAETTESLSFRSVASEALRKVHGSLSRKVRSGNSCVQGGESLSQKMRTVEKVRVKFHLKQMDLNSIPIRMDSTSEALGASFAGLRHEQAVCRNPGVGATEQGVGLRFCWTRGQGAASEEFVSWTCNHGEVRGTVTTLNRDVVEFDTQVRVPAGSRWYGRAVTSSGAEVDLRGIVSSSSRCDDQVWQVTCRLSGQISETELRALGFGG